MVMDEYMSGLNVSGKEGSAQKEHQSLTVPTIELMVYVDAGVQNDAKKNGFSVVDYILGIINIVSDVTTLFDVPPFLLLLCRWPACIVNQLCSIKLI